jgi:phosphocarrier protein
MKSFDYVITDPVGIHARPAGILVKEVKNYKDSTITLTKGEKSVNLLKLMALMQMGIKQGDKVTVTVEGGDEEAVCSKIEEFFKANM